MPELETPEALADVNTLPALPYVAHTILMALNNPVADMEEIADALQGDPGLTARIIAMANSAFFVGQPEVYKIDDAVIRLGLNKVRTMSSSILLANHFDGSKCKNFSTERYWLRAVQVSFSATKIARFFLTETDPDAAYLAGLLHNIGMIMLVHAFPDAMNQVFATQESNPDRCLIEVEREIIGVDHNFASRMLMGDWKVPEPIIIAAESHWDDDYEGPHKDLALMVRFCLLWSRIAYQVVPEVPGAPEIKQSIIEKVAEDCYRDYDKVESFARLLAN